MHTPLFRSVLLVGALGSSFSALAADIHVPFDQPTIQAGINAASNGDTVIVANGVYRGTGNRDLDFAGKAITVKSASGPTACILDCQSAARAVWFHSGESSTSLLEGFTVLNGSATPGGAVLCESASPGIRRCVFANNASTFNGGALSISGGQALVEGCTFIGNTASNAGGAIFNDAEALTAITACRFTGNSAAAVGGGAIYNNRSSSPTVINCEFGRNTTPAKGAAVYTENGLATFTNCTFFDNDAGQDGGGLQITNSGTASLRNCILWANSPNQIRTDLGTASVQYCDVQGGASGTGNIDADPLFVSPAALNLRLQTTSPCVDAGNNTVLPVGLATDIDGDKRFVDVLAAANVGIGTGPLVDMGAAEVQRPACPADITGDGVISVDDLLAVINGWGLCP